MKRYSIAAIVACIFTLGSMAQTSAAGSASGNASVTPGQSGANANASQSAQTSGASANVDASAQASHEHDNAKKEKSSQSGATAGGSGSGAATAGAGDASAMLSSGSTLQAELTKSVDAKKAKAGDEVTAKLTQDVKSNGKVVLHKGSKLVGHVTEAQAKGKESSESKLGILFDKAVVKGGQEVAFNGMIQALAPPAQSALSVAGDESSNLGGGVGGGGGSMGGGRGGSTAAGPLGSSAGAVTSAAGSTVGAVNNTAGSVTSSTGAVNGAVNSTVGAAANGTLNTASHGVVGMQGLALNTAATGNAQGSVITSNTRNVKLESGTQLVLQVAGSAAAR
ncbi:MAG TPA: hypothetical protein VE133_08110 [Candidatus Sulfotelmatobacter sp.]|nr:hypothetical protein [Candidatus Sulfotelmatobacter sp.]